MTPREELAALLREARLAAGYGSQGALAKARHVSRPLISRAENRREALPSAEVLKLYLTATGVDSAKIAELIDRIKSGTPEWFMPYLDAEAVARILRCWAPIVVPGILQCESYATALLSLKPYPPERLRELVTTRLNRQAVLERAYLTAVIDSHVFRRLIGSPSVMAEQCAHLVTMAQRPDVALHVVPEGRNVGLWGALSLATSRDNSTTMCLNTLRDITSTAPDLVSEAAQAFDQILGAAMPCDESLEFVRAMEEQWKSRVSAGASPATARTAAIAASK